MACGYESRARLALKNVLFEDSWVNNFSFSSSLKGMLYVAKSASVTLDKAVFRNIGRSVIMIDKGGSVSTSGCLSFIRVWAYKVHHSGVWGGFGAWTDKSTGPCASGTIGNNGQAVVAYTLPMLDCGLPSSGTIEGTVVYTLTKPCVCVNTVNIAVGARVTINANGHRIEGCSSGLGLRAVSNRQRSSYHQQRKSLQHPNAQLWWHIYFESLASHAPFEEAYRQLRLGVFVQFAL